MNEQAKPIFAIEKLYVKNFSSEVSNAPQIYLEREAHKIRVELATSSKPLGDSAFEVLLTVNVVATIGENTAFVIVVGQAGIFRAQNVPTEELEPLLSIGCPTILFPYAREVVSDAVARAGFSPVILQPVNFEALHLSRQHEAASEVPEEASVQ